MTDYLTVHAMRMGARGEQEATSDIPGVVFIQLDGVPAPLLENEIRSGNIPTISRWVRRAATPGPRGRPECPRPRR